MTTFTITAEERARLDAAPWPYRLEVARQLDAERAEREAAKRAAEDKRRYEETLAYAAHTSKRADEETFKHRTGQPCEPMFCRYEH